MKKKMVKRLMAASVAGTLAVTMFAGCGGSSDSKDSSAKTEDTGEDNSDKPDTWIADRTITVQAYVDDIGNTLPKDFNNTETMKKITELTGIKLDVKYTPGDSDAKVLASQLASGTIPDVGTPRRARPGAPRRRHEWPFRRAPSLRRSCRPPFPPFCPPRCWRAWRCKSRARSRPAR